MGSQLVALSQARYWCNEANLGYDQGDRLNIYPGGESDCSSLVSFCLYKAGYFTRYDYSTATIGAALDAAGFRKVKATGYKPSEPAVVLRPKTSSRGGHVAIWDGSHIYEAWIGETGKNTGNKPGDQTGNETREVGWYNFPWDFYYYFPKESNVQINPGQPVNDHEFWYRVHSAELGWLDPVRDGQWAGTKGGGLQMEAIKITPPEGFLIDVGVQVAELGWLIYEGVGRKGDYVYDPEMGSTGRGLGIEAIWVRIKENPENLHLKFQVHAPEYGDTGWVYAPNATGSVGLGLPLQAIQFVLEK